MNQPAGHRPLRLIVMRHAKSAWPAAGTDDHARPLNARGLLDAPRVGARLRELDWIPDAVLCSDARRAVETWACLAQGLGVHLTPRYTRDLYHASVGPVRFALLDLEPSVRTALVLGHNPGWEEAVMWLSGEDITLTTANAALLDTGEDSWAAALAHPALWRLHRVVRPKDL